MEEEIKFRVSPVGYNKNDVNNYIDQITGEYQNKVKEKDDELVKLRNQNKELKMQIEEIMLKTNGSEENKAKIADVLIKAQTTAEDIIEEAKTTALDEKRKIEEAIEEDREKLVDLKGELKKLKESVIDTLKLFETELNVYVKGDE